MTTPRAKPTSCQCGAHWNVSCVQEVAQLEGDQQELFAENQQLNKQQNALASEVRK